MGKDQRSKALQILCLSLILERHSNDLWSLAGQLLLIYRCFKCAEQMGDTRVNRDFKQVGPGSYGASLADKKKEPSFSMGANF